MRYSTGIPDGLEQEVGFSRMARELHVAVPAKVTATDLENGCVSVQGLGDVVDSAGNRHAYPVCERVPVFAPRAGGFVLTLPVKAGDVGLLVVCDKNIDFLENAAQEVGGYHYHNLTDGVFLPGLAYRENPVAGWEDGKVSLRNEAGTAKITIDEAGVVEIANSADVNVKTSGKFTVDASNFKLGADCKLTGGTFTDGGGRNSTSHRHPYTWTDPAGSGNTSGAIA